ncbi:MAG: hypothetical protein HY938_10975 [Nitrosomonadales bacterium]|nr:hypothetical protein [Nitrosomonadales bacterium]
MFLCRILVISLLTAGNAAVADTLDINLRDSSAQLQYRASIGRDTLGRSELHLGVLYADKDNFLSDFGLLVKDEIGRNTPGVTVGVGIKAVAARANASDASAVAIGAQVGFKPLTDQRFSIVGQAYVSPTILTFGEAKRYIETSARMEYEIIPQAVAYVGYRTTRFDLKAKPRAKLDDGLHIGLRMMF